MIYQSRKGQLAILSLVFGLIIFVLGFFNLLGFELNIPAIVAVFFVSLLLVYLLWSLFQPEFDEENDGGDYVPMFDAIEEADEEDQEAVYQKQKLS